MKARRLATRTPAAQDAGDLKRHRRRAISLRWERLAAELRDRALRQKGQVHDRIEQSVLSRPSAARHRGVPAHDRPALRRPREERACPGSGDEGRQADPSGQPEGRVRGRAEGRGHLPHRRARQRPAAPQAARRHREGAGRGQGAGEDHRLPGERGLFRGRRARDPRDREGPLRDQGARPRRGRGVRALRQAQPQHPRGGRLGGQRHHARGQARRHRGRASRRQARGQAEAPRGGRRRRAAGGDLRPDAGRDVACSRSRRRSRAA